MLVTLKNLLQNYLVNCNKTWHHSLSESQRDLILCEGSCSFSKGPRRLQNSYNTLTTFKSLLLKPLGRFQPKWHKVSLNSFRVHFMCRNQQEHSSKLRDNCVKNIFLDNSEENAPFLTNYCASVKPCFHIFTSVSNFSINIGLQNKKKLLKFIMTLMTQV